jgi:very-short-patch-repair endonuclease
MTDAERLLWWKLRHVGTGYKFRRQTPVGPFIIDFCCLEARVAVEVDGATHATHDEIAYDTQRTRYLESRGWRVLRIWNREVFENLDGVVEMNTHACWEHSNWLATHGKA